MTRRAPRSAETLAGEELDGSEPVLVVDGQDVTRQEFGDWLIEIGSETMRPVFVDNELVEALALREGYEHDPERVLERVRYDMEYTLDNVFGGRVERFLQQFGVDTLEEHIAKQVPVTEHHLAAEYLMARGHEVDPADVRALWLERYGEAGRALKARVIELQPPPIPADVDPKESRAERDRVFEETRDQARRLVERIQNGEDFGTLSRQHSVHKSNVQGGELSGELRLTEWPRGIHDELLAGRAGQVLGPIDDGPVLGRIWIFEVLEARDVPFESVADALESELANQRPMATERSGWLNVLMQRTEVVEL